MKQRIMLVVLVLLIILGVFLTPIGEAAASKVTGQKSSDSVSLITPSSGLLMNSVSSDGENGYGIRWFIDGTADALMFDTNDLCIVSLAEDNHTIPDMLGGCTGVCAGEYLLYFKMGHVPFKQYEGTPSCIYVVDKGGNIINTVFLMTNQEFNLNSGIAWKDSTESLYAIVETYYEGETEPYLTDTFVCEINITNNTVIRYYALDAEHEHRIIGAYEDKIILLHIPRGEDHLVDNDCFSVLNAVEPTETVVDCNWISSAISFVPDNYGNIWFTSKEKQGTVFKFDISSDAITETAVIEEVTNHPSGDIYIIGDVWDDHIIVSAESDEKLIGRYAVNIKSGDVTQILPMDDGFYPTIVSETKNGFILYSGSHYIDSIYYCQGEMYSFEELIDDYIMVGKADYWLNSSSFQAFDNKAWS